MTTHIHIYGGGRRQGKTAKDAQRTVSYKGYVIAQSGSGWFVKRSASDIRPVLPNGFDSLEDAKKAVDEYLVKGRDSSVKDGPNFEVIEALQYKNKRTGATASFYGAHPNRHDPDWFVEKVGWTVRNLRHGTVGAPSIPHGASRSFVESWVQAQESRLAEPSNKKPWQGGPKAR